MVVSREVVVVVTKRFLLNILLLTIIFLGFAQNKASDVSSSVYKKRVLDNIEIDILSSYYTQDGDNAAVTGGIGTEKLDDGAFNINIAIPLNADGVLTIDGTVSAYTSASSSNLNPFSGASSGGDDEDDDKDNSSKVTGSPWVESSGASKQDVWVNGNIGYSHSSDDRNYIWGANVNFANEYDYSSLGFGASFARLFNDQNTELGIKGNIYLDMWRPEYPTEIAEYVHYNGNFSAGYFQDIDIFDNDGNVVTGSNGWSPITNTLIDDKGRDSYSLSLSLSQMLSMNSQISLFFDLVSQKGWLANPMQRVYFKDKDNFYIGNASDIPNYTTTSNREVFQLADDIERLPDNRLKVPMGMRFNYYINEYFVLRNYYRYYADDWGLVSHTADIEVPVKVSQSFTLYPSYRYYTQTEAKYFAGYEEHLSTEEFYTSDFDLSKFYSSQFGFGIQYNDLLSKTNFWMLGLKNINLNYSYSKRNTGLEFHIISLGTKFMVK